MTTGCHEGVGYFPADDEPSSLDELTVWTCGYCAHLIFWAKACPCCGAPTPEDVGGRGRLLP